MDKIHFHINQYKKIIEVEIVGNFTKRIKELYLSKIKMALLQLSFKNKINHSEYKLNFYLHRMITTKTNLDSLIKFIKHEISSNFKQIDFILGKPMKICAETLSNKLNDMNNVKIFMTNKMFKHKYMEV